MSDNINKFLIGNRKEANEAYKNKGHESKELSFDSIKELKKMLRSARLHELLRHDDIYELLVNTNITLKLGFLEYIKERIHYFFAGFDFPNELKSGVRMINLGQAYAIYSDDETKLKLIDSNAFPMVAYYLLRYGSKGVVEKSIKKIKENPGIIDFNKLNLEISLYNDMLRLINKHKGKIN